MKSLSIKIKVILVITTCLLVGAVVLISLVEKSYQQNVALVARQALSSAQKSYANLEDDDYRALMMTSAACLLDDQMRDLYARRDRPALVAYLTPVCTRLKSQYGVSLFSFIDPDKKMFLRMLQPAKFGDLIHMKVLDNSAATHEMAFGSELGKAGYALRCTCPYYDRSHRLIGYFVLGDTYDSFLATMKQQTADDYAMVGLKTLCDEKSYHSGQIQKHLKDTWADFQNVVMLSATNVDHGTANFDRELQDVPAHGTLLGTLMSRGHVVARGVFPLVDLAGKQIGGVFVTHDITPLYQGMQTVKISASIAILLLMLLISGVIAFILNALVFARLKKTMHVATRMVGGDFETQIVPASDDEVGKLETLLEQFRGVFVHTIQEIEQERRQQESSKKGEQVNR